VRFRPVGADRIAVEGGTGRPRPDTLKVTVGYRDGFIGEGQISYAGTGAVARARLAMDIVAERLRITGAAISELRCDVIGVDSVLRGPLPAGRDEPLDVRARIVGRAATLRDAQRIGREVEAIWLNGPAGGGGATAAAREVIAAASVLVPRDVVRPRFAFVEA